MSFFRQKANVSLENLSFFQLPRESIRKRTCNINWFPLLESRLREGTTMCSELTVASGRIVMQKFPEENIPCKALKAKPITAVHRSAIGLYESDLIERETSRAVWRKTLNDVWHSIVKSWHGSISCFLKRVVSIHTCTLTSCDVFSLNWRCYWRRVKKAVCRWNHPSWWMDQTSLLVCIKRAEHGWCISSVSSIYFGFRLVILGENICIFIDSAALCATSCYQMDENVNTLTPVATPL